MKVKVQVVIESDGGDTKAVENIACLERGTLQPAELGLTLAEAKDLLESMQHTVVQQQIAEYLKQQAHCPGCGKKRRRKGHHNPIVYRTLFGKLRLPGMRFFNCGCQAHTIRTFSPLAHLLTERTAPELLYLETKFASLNRHVSDSEGAGPTRIQTSRIDTEGVGADQVVPMAWQYLSCPANRMLAIYGYRCR